MTSSPAAIVRTPDSRAYKLRFIRIIRSEWIKLFTLRSTKWILSLAIGLNIGITLALAGAVRWAQTMFDAQGSPPGGPDNVPIEVDPMSLGELCELVVTGCSFVGQLMIVILAILIITNEYSSGMIRSTFATVPRRANVLLAKMIVIFVVAVLVFAISVAVGFAGSYAIFYNSLGADLALISETSLRIMGGFIAAMVLIAWFTFGLGATIRSTAASIGTAVGVIIVLPMIANILVAVFSAEGQAEGWRLWLLNVLQFLPTSAGSLVTQTTAAQGSILGPWEGLGVLGGWALLSVVIGFIVVKRRDV